MSGFAQEANPKPIGALSPQRWAVYKKRFEEFDHPSLPPFHYGSHYLSAHTVLYYLLRKAPFTQAALKMQDGSFDLPDRLFHSIPAAWRMSSENIADVKELIPEFFFDADFLRNSQNLALGVKQNGEEVGDVAMPPWASSPERFIEIHREALESRHVSEHLHEWINLIFGYQQRGQAAVEAGNVFCHLTYDDSSLQHIQDEGILRATRDQMSDFGQMPTQLFLSPHPRYVPSLSNSFRCTCQYG